MPSGEIPQSTALAEATTDSLATLFSRDPEGLSKQDRAQIITALREQRGRVAAADAAGGEKKARATAAGSKLPLAGSTDKSIVDLGL